MKHNWLYLTLAGALVLVVIFLLDSPPTLLVPPGERDLDALTPYALIEDAHTRHFDEQGQLSYEFVAASLEHFRLDFSRVSPGDFTAMEQPQLTLHTEDAPWFVSADLGKVSDEGAVLTLWPNVRVWQITTDDGPPIELTTTHLEVRPQEKRVSTHVDVRISSPQGQLEAVGMEVDLISKRIQLLDRVRGYHEPIATDNGR